jgi:hypothetical protein
MAGLTQTSSQQAMHVLPDFLRSSGSGTGSLSLVSTIEELLEIKSSGSGLEIRAYGRRDQSSSICECWQ